MKDQVIGPYNQIFNLKAKKKTKLVIVLMHNNNKNIKINIIHIIVR